MTVKLALNLNYSPYGRYDLALQSLVMARKRIIIVEDEQDFGELVAGRLTREHYDVEVVCDGLEGLRKIRTKPPDLVLLDLMLPGMSGTEIATELRSDPRTERLPIIMMTAKNAENDIVVGLHAGADDYVTKPFSMSVLAARISAVLRRAGSSAAQKSGVLRAGPICIDRHCHRVRIDDQSIPLTLTEFRLLVVIVAGNGRVFTRDQLVDGAIGYNAVVTDRTIDVHITSLRRKLGSARRYVETVRGAGYRLATAADIAQDS
jgi:two-component system, OmpR family, phosphate regulon response regulator PhoB